MLQNTFSKSTITNVTRQAPGVRAPLNEVVLDDFTQDNGWLIVGAQSTYSASGMTVTLSDSMATVTKTFSYSTWQYSDMAIRITQVSEGCTWELAVKGIEENAQTMIIQPESSSANSSFGENFTYSLKGIAGAEPLSNWNDPTLESKIFEIILTFRGDIGQSVALGLLLRIEPNYEIPQALPSNVVGTLGTIDFSGDPTLNVDDLRNDDPTNTTSLKEYRNLSLPFSRLVTNPEYNFDNQAITPIEQSLDLRFGAYYGIRGNANKTTIDGTSLIEKKSGFQDSSYNSLLSIDGIQSSFESLESAWYPHKVELQGTVPDLGTISTVDFFVDEHTIGRMITLSEVTGDFLEIEVRDSTVSTSDYHSNNLKCIWDATNEMVIKTDSLYDDWNQNLFLTAIKVVALSENGFVDEEATTLIVPPEFTEGSGKYQIPTSISRIGFVIGYATREEGLNTAIDRALNGIGLGSETTSIEAYLQQRKTYWDELLASVPVPADWGLTDEAIYHYEVVSAEKHRLLYYAGWTHILSNILAPTPETGYAFTQQALGKPSRQCAGASMTPPNNCWEGLLQIQDLMYINPSIAWSGMEGFMSMVDANGYLSGEVLPVRMAQTIWMIHTISPDSSRLAALYPALKRHLEWKFANPRWVYETINVENEIDSEFMISVMYDTRFMIEICTALGGDFATEISYWEGLYSDTLSNYAYWMFCEPVSHEALYSYPQNSNNSEINRKVLRNGAELPDPNDQRGICQYIFLGCVDIDPDNSDTRKFIHANNAHLSDPPVPRDTTDLPQMLCSGLVLPDIPTHQAQQLEQFTLDIINPALSLCGFPILKWAPSSLVTYGLINRGFYDEAKVLLDSYIVRGVEIWQFCENYFWNATGPRGTYPTSFGASQIIDSTFMKNGFINDGGARAIPSWSEGENKPVDTPIEITTDVPIDLNDPTSTVEQIGLPDEIRQVYTRTSIFDETYELGKVVTVTWLPETLQATEIPQVYTIQGTTEVHNNVTATITSTAHIS